MRTKLTTRGHFLDLYTEVDSTETQGDSAHVVTLAIRADQLMEVVQKGDHCRLVFKGQMEFQEFHAAVHFLSAALAKVYGEPKIRSYSMRDVTEPDHNRSFTYKISEEEPCP